MRLFCDIDNTVNLHWKRIRRFTVNGACDYSKANSYDEVIKDEVLEGSVEALNKLSKKYEIHFLTARSYPRAFEVTKDWLDKNGFPYSSIIVVNSTEEKIPILADSITEGSTNLYIDDLSRRHETNPPYTVLYNDVINKVNSLDLDFELFCGNWMEILEKRAL